MVSDPRTVEAALDQFLLQLEADGRSSHTILQYKRHVLLLARWLAAQGESATVAALRPEVVARFMISGEARNKADGAPKRPTAVNALRSSVRCFCAYLHATGLVPANPGRLLRRAHCSPRPSRALDEAEVERFLAALDADKSDEGRRDRVLFTLMLATGIRIGSALGLDVEDVDLRRGEMLLRRAKGQRVDRVFLPQAMVPVLAEHMSAVTSGPVFRNRRGGRLTARHANRRIGQALREAGIGHLNGSHCLRHTFGTRLYGRTGDVLLVKEALGHRSVASTLVYARVDDRRLRGALSGIS